MKNKKKNDNLSLLDQMEIDSLVKFLTDQKNTIDSDVMEQNSIDKLIHMMQTDQDRLALNITFAYSDVDVSTWNDLNFRSSENDVCELTLETSPKSGYISLSIVNSTLGTVTELYPDNFDKTDTKEWGLSIPPMSFCQIASLLSIKFKKETYDEVCTIYARHNYHDENHKLPEILLPDNEVLINCLL